VSLAALKLALGDTVLLTPEKVQAKPGCATGFAPLDNFLIWKGFPKGALSLLTGEPGLGASRLCLQAAARLTEERKWVAWVNGAETSLNGGALKTIATAEGGANIATAEGRANIRLDRFLVVSAPVDIAQKLWALQELCSLSLFELISCDLEWNYLRDGQLLKLKKIAARYKVALVLLSRTQRTHPFFSLAIEFTKNNIVVARALHRPTPHLLERRELYADTLPQLATGRSFLCG
jgi:hypothetical protein